MIKKSYMASSLSEAVGMIKREMGSHASILETKSHPAKKTLFKNVPPQIEVVAGVDERHLNQKQIEFFTSGITRAKAGDPGLKPPPSMASLASAVLEKRGLGVSVRAGGADVNFPKSAKGDGTAREQGLLRDKVRELEEENARLKKQLDAMEQGRDEIRLMRNVMKAVPLKKPEKKKDAAALLNRDRWEILDWLVDSGLSEPLVMDWQRHVAGMPMTAKFGELFDESIRFFFTRCPSPDAPLPRLLALIGAKGAGRTSSAMKLAYALKGQGRKTALVSLDAENADSAGICEVFGAEAGIPFMQARQSRGFARLIKKFDEYDHVVFDTPPASRHDKAGLKKLCQKLETLGTANFAVYAGGEAEYREVLGFSRELAAEGLVFTHLDRARRPGYFYNMMAETGLAARYFGIGERVPSGFEAATPERLVSLLFKMDAESGDADIEGDAESSGKEAS